MVDDWHREDSKKSVKKLYCKVYQDKFEMEGISYIVPFEKLREYVEQEDDCGNGYMQVAEMVMMSEYEFEKLPEFEGF